jgi:adenylylsulfate kinase
MILLIVGLPGAGKTALAEQLVYKINAIHLNGDEVRSGINSDLGFSGKDRVEQARRMGEMARLLSRQGHIVVVDFVCPTNETRDAFGKPDAFIWVDRIKQSRYEDTNQMWEDPEADLVIPDGLTIDNEVDIVISHFGLYDWSLPTALLLGRYQPWHEGHGALRDFALQESPQAVIGVRSTYKTSEKDPLKYEEVKSYIKDKVNNPFVIRMPNITRIVYGRDVGYSIEKADLGQEIESISATQKRKEMGI